MSDPYFYKNILWLDLETFSTIPIKTAGSYRYAENSEILLWAWALNDSEVCVWDICQNSEIPEKLIKDLRAADTIGWHNGNFFDRRVILHSEYADLIKGKKYFDTMVQAYMHGLPGGLELLSSIFSLSEKEAKKKEGRRLIQLFCKPLPENQKLYRATFKTHPDEWNEFIDYARHDIIAMRKLHKLMPKWNLTATEYELQQFNLRMNDKGIPIDTGFCEKALVMAENAKNRRDSKIIEMTDGEVQAATQRDKLLKYICEIWGVDLPDMQKATLERRLNDENLPEELKEIIALRLESAANNTRKYQSFLNMVCQDGRVHGAIQFRGAFRTGRDAARLVQPQNMIKPGMKWEDIESGIDAIKKGYYDLVCG